MPKDMSMSKQMHMSKETAVPHEIGRGGGHLYLETNEAQNCRSNITGPGTVRLPRWNVSSRAAPVPGSFKPISGQESAPNSFEGAASVILTPDRRFLFATNGGANSFSSFAVDEDGRLTLLDIQPVPRRRFPSERHRQITSLLSFEANALCVALVRPWPPPADVGRSPRESALKSTMPEER